MTKEVYMTSLHEVQNTQMLYPLMGPHATGSPHCCELSLRESLENLAQEAKAECIEWIQVSGRSPITDYLLLCSGRSVRHTHAIAERFIQNTKSFKQLLHRSIDPTGAWHILDFDTVIVHIMLPETRSYYDLSSLWKTRCSS